MHTHIYKLHLTLTETQLHIHTHTLTFSHRPSYVHIYPHTCTPTLHTHRMPPRLGHSHGSRLWNLWHSQVLYGSWNCVSTGIPSGCVTPPGTSVLSSILLGTGTSWGPACLSQLSFLEVRDHQKTKGPSLSQLLDSALLYFRAGIHSPSAQLDFSKVQEKVCNY